jgi:DNA-binding GntR family transcriptional regulator
MQEQPTGPEASTAGVSLATSAYERLREAIVRGEFRPNQRLVESELAEWLQLSRTPLREGLARLAGEGLILSQRRGWIVREHTPEEISEIHEVRAALEGMAAYLAAKRATDGQIARVVELHAHATETDALASEPGLYLVEYNDAFHDAVVTCASNERLRHFIRQNREFFFSYRLARMYSFDEAKASIAGHEEVVRALTSRDADGAEAAMREHILQARDVVISKNL